MKEIRCGWLYTAHLIQGTVMRRGVVAAGTPEEAESQGLLIWEFAAQVESCTARATAMQKTRHDSVEIQ